MHTDSVTLQVLFLILPTTQKTEYYIHVINKDLQIK